MKEFRLTPPIFINSEKELSKRKRDNKLTSLLGLHGPLQNVDVIVRNSMKHHYMSMSGVNVGVKCPIEETYNLITTITI